MYGGIPLSISTMKAISTMKMNISIRQTFHKNNQQIAKIITFQNRTNVKLPSLKEKKIQEEYNTFDNIAKMKCSSTIINN